MTKFEIIYWLHRYSNLSVWLIKLFWHIAFDLKDLTFLDVINQGENS